MTRRRVLLDASLQDWSEVQEDHHWSGLLLGNGSSRAVWERFKYKSLFGKAASDEIDHPLTAEDQEFFNAMQKTRNFEAVLGALATARMVNEILDIDSEEIEERYNSIRRALIEAVHAVHLPWRQFPESSKIAVREALLAYDVVYTTNYDLLVYWVMMAGTGAGFKDYFWGEEFDVTKTEIWGNVTRVLYLHGGLHLYRLPDGGTYKQHAGPLGNLLDQFGRVSNQVPLFITEGSHTEKLRAIARSDYLSFALQEFARHDASLVIFGHSLGKTDHHLSDFIRGWQEPASDSIRGWRAPEIAYGMLPADDADIVTEKARIVGLFPESPLVFFNALTHPLGAAELAVQDPDEEG